MFLKIFKRWIFYDLNMVKALNKLYSLEYLLNSLHPKPQEGEEHLIAWDFYVKACYSLCVSS